MILPSINTAVCRKKIQRYFRKLSQQFSWNNGSLLVLVSLYFFFLSGLSLAMRVGLRSPAQKGLRSVRGSSSGEDVAGWQKVSSKVALQGKVS